MFWGLIMEPQKRYTQVIKKAFHISAASLDISNSDGQPSQVMCGYEGRNYLLCTLEKPDKLQCPLDLYFEEGTTVSFATNGKSNVHLTGYLTKEFDDAEEESDEEVNEGLQEFEVKAQKNPRKDQNAKQPPNKKAKKSEEVLEQEEGEDDSDDSDDSDVDMEELMKQDLQGLSEEESGEEEEEGDEDDDEDEDEEEDDVGEEEQDSEDELSKEEIAKLTAVRNGLEKKSKNKQETPKKVKQQTKETPTLKKTPGPKLKNQENGDMNDSKKENKTKESATPSKKRTLSGGVIVEDLKEGQGEPATNGKFVHVYYEGRLKSNNKVFDKTMNGPGFGFRLGKGEVIKGWDIGLKGMKIGGKRRITVPPPVGYGAKGSPPVIPPNATLIFEVELKKVK